MRRLLLKIAGGQHLLDEITALAARVIKAEAKAELADTLRREAEVTEKAVLSIFGRLLEPAQDSSCMKVRLRNSEEADRFARHVEKASRAKTGTLVGYKCRHCPPQPVTLEKFWHVTHADPAERGKGGAQYRRRQRELGRIAIPSDLIVQRLRSEAS